MPAHRKNLSPLELLSGQGHLDWLSPNTVMKPLLKLIPETAERILDIGCFCGGNGMWLRARNPRVHLTGIEVLEAAASRSAQVYDRVLTGRLEDQQMPSNVLPAGGFDAILFADVLEHLYNPWQELVRCRPLLAPDGVIALSVPNVQNLGVIAGLLQGRFDYASAGLLDVTHIRFFTRATLIDMLSSTGYRLCHLGAVGDPRFRSLFDNRALAEGGGSVRLGRLTLHDLKPSEVRDLIAFQWLAIARPA